MKNQKLIDSLLGLSFIGWLFSVCIVASFIDSWWVFIVGALWWFWGSINVKFINKYFSKDEDEKV